MNGIPSKARSELLASFIVLLRISRKENEPVDEISNDVVCGTSKASDQPAHTRSLIRAFTGHLSIL